MDSGARVSSSSAGIWASRTKQLPMHDSYRGCEGNGICRSTLRVVDLMDVNLISAGTLSPTNWGEKKQPEEHLNHVT